MIKPIIQNIRLILLQFLLINQFDPVSIWIEDKGNILHSSVGQFFLEGDVEIFEAGTGVFEGGDGDTDLEVRIGSQSGE
jgi:hypothetical protein